MKEIRYFLHLFLFFLVTPMVAQDDFHQRLLNQLEEEYGIEGGEWLLSSNEYTTMGNIFYWGLGNYTREDADGQLFDLSATATVSELTENPWQSGMGIINNRAIEVGDHLLIAVWMRGTTANAEGASTHLIFENAMTYEREMALEVELSKEWQQYLIPFESKRAYDAWNAQIVWHLNFDIQTIEIGGLAILNYSQTYAFHELPEETHITYEGRDLEAVWRTAALERIENHRKANFEILVVDEDGKPIPNATVGVKMQQHDFVFGTAVDPCALGENSCQSNTYQSKIANLDGKGRGFNEVLFEDALSWANWENDLNHGITETTTALEWLASEGINIRGQNLIPTSWNSLPTDLSENSQDIAYLQSRIDTHLEEILNNPTIAENVQEWDVLNEVVWNRSLEFAFAGKAGYTTGRELYADIFRKVEEESPDATYYLNDCVAICDIGDDSIFYNNLKKYLQEMVDANAPIDGIGFQAHIGSKPVPPETVYNTLEDFHQTFGLKAKITEFDMAQMSQSVTADYMRDFLTAVFSHSSTEGFLMAGYWDGAHALGDAPLFNEDWTLKPAGQAFMVLVFKDWWTNETLVTDENGRIVLRSFKGMYEIPVSFNGETYLTTYQLKTDEILVIELPFATNIEEIERQNRFYLFPNPSNGSFELQYDFPQNSTLEVEVYDMMGRRLEFFTKNTRPQKVFNMPFDLQQGIYFVQLKDGQRVMVEKVVVN